MALAVLRDGLVLVELGLPCAGVEWRHDAGHRLPFDDRQARLGEAGCPAHRERHEHQGCHRQQPKPEGAAAGLGTRSKAGHAITSCDHWVAGGDADHIVERALPQLSEPMPIRLRKLIGAIMLIVLVVTWALLAMALAQSPRQRRDRGDLLRGRRPRLGVAGNAAHSLDVAPGIATRPGVSGPDGARLRAAPRQRRGAFGGA